VPRMVNNAGFDEVLDVTCKVAHRARPKRTKRGPWPFSRQARSVATERPNCLATLRLVIAHDRPRVLFAFTSVIPARSDNCHPTGARRPRQGRGNSVEAAAREARETLTRPSTPVRSRVGASAVTVRSMDWRSLALKVARVTVSAVHGRLQLVGHFGPRRHEPPAAQDRLESREVTISCDQGDSGLAA